MLYFYVALVVIKKLQLICRKKNYLPDIFLVFIGRISYFTDKNVSLKRIC